MATIVLNTGALVLLDDDDFSLLSRWRWYLTSTGYAARTTTNGVVLMHRCITNAPKGMVVDHINHDKLDNRKANLRIVTQGENAKNRTRIGPVKISITIRISPEQIKLAEALAKHRMMLTGETASRSSEFGRAIEQLAAAELPKEEAKPAAQVAA